MSTQRAKTRYGIIDALAQPLAGGAPYKLRVGQHTSVAAVDTLVTDLDTVVGVIASYDDDAADGVYIVTASVGDQAGSPAAGSFTLSVWKTDGTDPTPVAATTFGKKVNWIAFGTKAE